MKQFAVCVLSAALAATPLAAQTTAKQDAKKAGHETAAATKDTGHAIAKGSEKAYDATKRGTVKAANATADGSKKAYRSTKHGTAVAATKTARGTKSVAKQATGDKTPTTTPHDPPKQN